MRIPKEIRLGNTHKYLLHLAAKFNNNREVNDGAASSGTNNHQELDNVSHEISKYDKQAWDQITAEGYTPVHVAAHYGNNAFIQYVIEKVENGEHRVLQSTKNTRKMNVLHICAEQSASSSTENEKDKNKKDENKNGENKKDENETDENKKDKIKYVL